MKQFSIFTQHDWFFRHYDGRRKEFKGISKETFEKCRNTHLSRRSMRLAARFDYDTFNGIWRRKMLNYFATIPYKYEGDYMDDYEKYQRPSSNGIGYVAICPGERANNTYIEDKILVAYLKKKYERYWANKQPA